MPRILLTLVLVLGLLASYGCGAQPGKTVVSYSKGDPERIVEVSEDASYALYSRSAMNPTVTYALKRGDKLGFMSEGGKVYAVAGDKKDEISVGSMTGYYWKKQEEER